MKYHNYIFFSVDKSMQSISQNTLEKYKKEFITTIENSASIVVYSYTLLGLKGKNVFMFWIQSESLESIQELLNDLLHTPLGRNLNINGTLFGITRPSQYAKSIQSTDTFWKGSKYLVIYPFTKTHEWYMLSFEKRKELMKGHIAVGKNYPQISQILLYSFGIDNNEFIVSYETDDLSHFQQLVMDLRYDSVRSYTLLDTPIFTCIYRSLEDTLNYI